MKQNELATWLRVIVLVALALVIFVSAALCPPLASEMARLHPEFDFLCRAGLVYFWLTMLPVLYALYCAWCIFGEIAHDRSFCEGNSIRLRSISRVGLAEVFLYFLAAVLLGVYGAVNTGVLLVLLFVIFVSLTVAIAAAALSHLVDKAVVLKQDNDLTI